MPGIWSASRSSPLPFPATQFPARAVGVKIATQRQQSCYKRTCAHLICRILATIRGRRRRRLRRRRNVQRVARLAHHDRQLRRPVLLPLDTRLVREPLRKDAEDLALRVEERVDELHGDSVAPTAAQVSARSERLLSAGPKASGSPAPSVEFHVHRPLRVVAGLGHLMHDVRLRADEPTGLQPSAVGVNTQPSEESRQQATVCVSPAAARGARCCTAQCGRGRRRRTAPCAAQRDSRAAPAARGTSAARTTPPCANPPAPQPPAASDTVRPTTVVQHISQGIRPAAGCDIPLCASWWWSRPARRRVSRA